MTAIILYSPLDASTASAFRTSCGNIDATFVSTGWVQSSDTGQINWSSVALPGGANTSAGYSIYHMNDTLQATYPVFIKIEYGTSAASTIGFWITIGTGSNGSGTLTGILNTRLQFGAAPANNTGIIFPSYFSGSSSRYSFVLCPYVSSNNCLCVLSIERTKDSAGALTNAGVMLFTLGTVITAISQYLPFSGTIPAQYSAWNCNVPYSNTITSTSAYKNTVALYPIRCWTPGESGPSSNIFIYQTGDITPSPYTLTTPNTVSLSLFDGNVTSTYVPILHYNSYWAVIAGSNRGNVTNVGIAMRYE